jgi:3-oxoacyl-[acyl-carrier protein] reductase
MKDDPTLIVGASSDIGVALLERLLRSGGESRLIAHCFSSAERFAALKALDPGGRIEPITADFSSLVSVSEMAQRVVSEFGVPGQVIYLPGLKLRYERFSKFDLDYFNRDLDVQVRAAITLLKPLLPRMAKLPRAKIVFVISSVTRGVTPKFMSMYSVVKHAQLGLVRALASEYAATRVTINAVSPAMVETRFLDGIPGIAKEMTAASVPRGRLATTQEVVGAISFLLSTDSDFVTGIELPVTGGSGF